jgi:transcriptional regulator
METEKMINMALAYKGISQTELARLMGTTSSNFNQKVKRNTFTREELENKIGRASCRERVC